MPQDKTAPAPRLSLAPEARPAASTVRFFSVVDLSKYQHYKDRNPPWVKLHGEQLEDYDFQQLPDATRFHLLALTYMASKYGNKIPNDPVWVAGRIGARDPVDLAALYDAGFLTAWQPRAQEARPGEQLLPYAEAPAANPSPDSDSTDASESLAERYQDASNLLAQRQRQNTETEAEAHTEADTAAASAARLCPCCGVSVCSEFSYGDALDLVRLWKREGRLVGGKPIENPGGLARVLHREGTADDEIRLLKHPPPRREFTDEPCPACFGAKQETVQGKGARPCTACVDEAGRRTGRRPKDVGSPAGRSP